MKIAIVHDWLVTYTGAEKVLEQILNLYPNADIFTIVDLLPEANRFFLQNKQVKTSFVQKLPFVKSKYRSYLFLMPLAIEQFDFSQYDLIISSSHAVAKGVITGPDQLHISYVHTPIRYAWDLQHQYLKESNLDNGFKSLLARCLLHYIRLWDYRTAAAVDNFIANSNFIKSRISKVYNRDADVIYPPVNTNSFKFQEKKKNYYLTASRLVPYKKVDLIVEAFALMPDKELIVIGDGPDMNKIKNKASNNVKILGHQSFENLISYMQLAKAFVFAAEEDFGITPVEAQACGTPVIAFGKGGALETVRGIDQHNEPTGVFFYNQSVDAIINAIEVFEKNKHLIIPENCRLHAMRFSEENFKTQFELFVKEKMLSRNSKHAPQNINRNEVILEVAE
ncbi:glycosyltransferase family 4 protein [Paenibacillus urinalis]|uniref:Glycosyltransferase family 4 protein n=1 Tax=Paenibacillus urinalis TaxID=521520 RepID=A0AAX3N345_9BACL|nr:glycosyltransferase family 4 protein [Paenibacillus urinalis]WDH83791.1 glycosyltransferase family 4 protein [Paenibacillus urinalis]